MSWTSEREERDPWVLEDEEEHLCPDCDGEYGPTEFLYRDTDDDGNAYSVFQCGCGTHHDGEGYHIFSGSDYDDRMTERKQMGLTNF